MLAKFMGEGRGTMYYMTNCEGFILGNYGDGEDTDVRELGFGYLRCVVASICRVEHIPANMQMRAVLLD